MGWTAKPKSNEPTSPPGVRPLHSRPPASVWPGAGCAHASQPAQVLAAHQVAPDRQGCSHAVLPPGSDGIESQTHATPQPDESLHPLSGITREVVGTQLYYNAGHPGVEKPHYHVVLWHVPPAEAKLHAVS